MSPRLLAACALLAGVGACFGGAEAGPPASGQPGAVPATVAGQPAASGSLAAGATAYAPVSPADLEGIVPPEEADAEIVWLVQVPGVSGGEEVYEERLHADGRGRFSLVLEGWSTGRAGQRAQPTPTQQILYLNRQGFLLRYRAPHLGDPQAVVTNYDLFELAGPFTVAGRPCRRFRLESRRGTGAWELAVDQDTQVLLSWTRFDAAGQPVSSLQSQSVTYQADHSGVAWAVEDLAWHPYSPATDDLALGFEPMRLAYLPRGYYLLRRDVLLTEPLLPTTYLEVYTDGVQFLFAAQHGDSSQPGPAQDGTFRRQAPGAEARFASPLRTSRMGQYQVYEGTVGAIRLILVGAESADEMVTLFGSATPR